MRSDSTTVCKFDSLDSGNSPNRCSVEVRPNASAPENPRAYSGPSTMRHKSSLYERQRPLFCILGLAKSHSMNFKPISPNDDARYVTSRVNHRYSQ